MIRIGTGFDAHRLVEGRRLVLGGVEVPCARGLDGHSDADVLCHALIDALLGAVADGDIGQHFPDSDAQWKDANSLELLTATALRLAGHGFRVGNVDVTVIAEAPRLSPHITAMRTQVAEAMGVDAGYVSIKATTVEGMGAMGRGEGISAMAVATIVKEEG